jgi:hypothetical protein
MKRRDFRVWHTSDMPLCSASVRNAPMTDGFDVSQAAPSVEQVRRLQAELDRVHDQVRVEHKFVDR